MRNFVTGLCLTIAGAALLPAMTMTIHLEPVPLADAPAVSGVRLLDRAGIPLLLGAAGKLFVPSESGKWPELNLGGLPGAAWDARLAADGSLAAVYTKPGSAFCWIMSRKSGAETALRLHEETFVVYVQPHFVKGLAAGLSVSAILHKNDRAQVMLFRSAERQTEPRPLGVPANFLSDARVLRDADGYWLFTQTRITGAAAGAGPRDTSSGTEMPGILHAHRFDKDLKPVGQPIPILGAQAVYEFDVEPAPDGKVAIFATTPAGAVYALSALSDSPFPHDAWKETAFKMPLSSPSLLLHDGIAHCAAVESLETKEARVLRGRIE